MQFAILAAGGKPPEIVERLVVRLKIEGVILAGVDDLSLLTGRSEAVRQCRVPSTGIPSPADAFGREGIADCVGRLWR
jgi:hypothetical protein